MATVKRTGPWRIRAHSVANNVMGSIHLDLTQATFDAPVVEITGTHLMGSMSVRVPLGTNVRDETTKVLGETSIKDIGDPDPSMPTVVITRHQPDERASRCAAPRSRWLAWRPSTGSGHVT